MTFLFEHELTVNGYTEKLRIYETVENSFFAEYGSSNGAPGFHFHRMKEEWVSDNPAKQDAAEALGQLIDNFKTDLTF